MTIDQELLLHKIETHPMPEITLDTILLVDLIMTIREELTRDSAQEDKERDEAYQMGYEAGLDEARSALASL